MFGGLCEALRVFALSFWMSTSEQNIKKIVYPLLLLFCHIPNPNKKKATTIRAPRRFKVPPHFLPANWVIHQVPLVPLVGWVRWLVRLAASGRLGAIPMVQLGKVEHFPHDCCAWWKLFPWSSLRASPATTWKRWVFKGGLEKNVCMYIYEREREMYMCVYTYIYIYKQETRRGVEGWSQKTAFSTYGQVQDVVFLGQKSTPQPPVPKWFRLFSSFSSNSILFLGRDIVNMGVS